MEIDVPMIVALNMMDAVEKNGDKLDAEELEKKLGVPVVKISALKERGSKTHGQGDQVLEAAAKGRNGVKRFSDRAPYP